MIDDAALFELLQLLKQRNYEFTTVTPATHARVLERPCPEPSLRDIFGWNREFQSTDLDEEIFECLTRGDLLQGRGEKLRSRVRVASLADDLYLHSSYPTTAQDAVFFGPDTYRFARFVREQLPLLEPRPGHVVDLGTGSGTGAIAAARLLPSARVTATDINPVALRFAALNAKPAGVQIETLQSPDVPEGADLVIANPPYIMDPDHRAYRDGGDLYGGQVALEWTRNALDALVPGGTMLLYTGASVVDGRTPLVDAVRRACEGRATIDIEETDPDVFGEELDQPAYADVERIGLICVRIRKT